MFILVLKFWCGVFHSLMKLGWRWPNSLIVFYWTMHVLAHRSPPSNSMIYGVNATNQLIGILNTVSYPVLLRFKIFLKRIWIAFYTRVYCECMVFKELLSTVCRYNYLKVGLCALVAKKIARLSSSTALVLCQMRLYPMKPNTKRLMVHFGRRLLNLTNYLESFLIQILMFSSCVCPNCA